MIIAIDFDGTIVEQEFPNIGAIKKNAKEVINKLHEDGHYIIIWTCRYTNSDLRSMIQFLIENDIWYDSINNNCDNLSFVPHPKIYADVYIDDHNLGGVPDWYEISKIICKMT